VPTLKKMMEKVNEVGWTYCTPHTPFMVGDKVFDNGNGIVTDILTSNTLYPVAVTFDNDGYRHYTLKGYRRKEDRRRSLFHGHDLHYASLEKVPIRPILEERWLVVTYDKALKVFHPMSFKSEEEALERATSEYGCRVVVQPYKVFVER